LVIEKVEKIIQQEYKSDGEIEIINLGLDLENVVPWFKRLIDNSDYDDVLVRYRGLIINPESNSIKDLINGPSNIKTSIVTASLENSENIQNFGFSGIDFEIRSNSEIPFFHGFVIDKKHLFLSFTEVDKGKINGGNFPYLYIKIDRTSKINRHLFNMFLTWFEYLWKNAPSKVKFTT
jgi:hypothetical protein